jgi:DNA-binding MarR family transcriptional regulator|tara:strand:- start:8048 stop:8551 length:504 start_codon:yes stop_codon:yes gene_type:complete
MYLQCLQNFTLKAILIVEDDLMTKKTDFSTERDASFGYVVEQVVRKFEEKAKLELSAIGLNHKFYIPLLALLDEEGVNQRQLGLKLNFPEYFTSRNIDAMVKAGYAERRPDPNSRRSVLVFLTKAGRAKAECLPGLARKFDEDVLAELTKDEQQKVVELLKKVADIT